MSNIEALERLVGSRILSVALIGRFRPWRVEITTTDGETIIIMISVYEDLIVEVTDVH